MKLTVKNFRKIKKTNQNFQIVAFIKSGYEERPRITLRAGRAPNLKRAVNRQPGYRRGAVEQTQGTREEKEEGKNEEREKEDKRERRKKK